MLENPITLDREGFGEIEHEVILCAIDELKILLEVNGILKNKWSNTKK